MLIITKHIIILGQLATGREKFKVKCKFKDKNIMFQQIQVETSLILDLLNVILTGKSIFLYYF